MAGFKRQLQPTIADAKLLAERCRSFGVIIIALGQDGDYKAVSYGCSLPACREMEHIVEMLCDRLEAGDNSGA